MIQSKEVKIKIVSILVLFILCGLGIMAKLFQLQIKNHRGFDERALSQYKGRFYKNSNRGNIFDRNMRQLAINIQVKSVYANPSKIQDIDSTIRTISSILVLPKAELRKKLNQKSSFVYLKRKISPAEYENLRNHKLPGVHFSTEYKRFYPKMELAARTIGFAGIDNQGLSGIEFSFDDYLSQGAKWVNYQRDRHGRSVELVKNDSVYLASGRNDLVLTIDKVLQYHALKAVREKVIETGARRGLAIIMEPNTGELLAIAQYPSYNANLYKNYPTQKTKNGAILDTFEPGSTFKLILASAVIEEKDAQAKDVFFCENGSLDIGGIVIHEAGGKQYGLLTLTEILGKSSNIGAVKLAQLLGKEKFYKYIKKFGFGEKTGINFPGEGRGIVRVPSKWSKVSIGSISIGQEISTTPLQLVTAVSVIANGGYLMKPQIVKQIIQNGRVKNVSPQIVRRVISLETVETMKEILTYAVDHGTGKKGAIKGYKVGGKTGTAQKIDPATKKYSSEKYVASFVGFVPVENPRFAILVIIDEPQGVYWGGSIAAPVFREIGEKALRYFNVPSEMNRTHFIRFATNDKLPGTQYKGVELNSDVRNNISGSEENLEKTLDGLIAGVKKYFWEVQEASAQAF